MRTKILIGIPSYREDVRFQESLNSFVEACKNKYDLTVLWQKNVRLQEAQNIIAKRCLNGDYEYILFLDDDHWGHTVEMLDCLVEAKSYMATIKTYSRHWPYPCAAYKKITYYDGSTKWSGLEGNGPYYKEVDMTGFPMTLINKDLLLKLEYPYFRERNTGGTEWATDEEFCERIRSIGIKPVVCYQHCLPHDEITQDNVVKKRISNLNQSQRVQLMIEEKKKILINQDQSDKEVS